jgi:hypothetical protein
MKLLDLLAYGTAEGVRKEWDTRGRGKKVEMGLHEKLVHAVVAHDQKQMVKRGYNMYAMPQYLEALKDVEEQVGKGKSIREALLDNFNDRLLDRLLKAVGEPKATLEEIKGRT